MWPLLVGPKLETVAIRVGKAETITNGTIEHAVILIENGKITAIGEDLPIERGIPILDRPDWVVMPGLVNPYTRLGLDSRAGSDFNPEVSALPELLPRSPEYRKVLEAGVTTLGIYPPGTGVCGQTAVIRPSGGTSKEMLVKEGAYLKIYFRADSRSKKMVKDAWAKVDDYDDKVKKAKEKWEKDAEKAKSKKSEKKEETKGDEKPKDEKPKDEEKKDEPKKDDAKPADAKKDEVPAVFVPPEPDPKVKPFVQMRDGKMSALVSIGQAGDWLHWLDAIGERKFDWALRVPMTRELDLYEVEDKIGEKKVRIILEPELTLFPGTMRQRNLPAELAKAGAKLVLIPRNDTVRDHEHWLSNVGEMVGAGLDRAAALRSVTLEAAAVLGMQDQIGSLEKGKTANLVFFNGDPLEVGTRVQAVMLEGTFVSGEVKQ
jgi:imidazolonepropionase-like amidohydrolase